MLTKEIFQKARKTSHSPCQNETGCIHAEPFTEAFPQEELKQHLMDEAISAMRDGMSPLLAVYYDGLHVGYRAAQLEIEAEQDALKTAASTKFRTKGTAKGKGKQADA